MHCSAWRKFLSVTRTLSIVQAATDHNDCVGILQNEIGSPISVDANLTDEVGHTAVEKRESRPAGDEGNVCALEPARDFSLHARKSDPASAKDNRPLRFFEGLAQTGSGIDRILTNNRCGLGQEQTLLNFD